MDDLSDMENVADLVLSTHAVIDKHGTEEMKTLIRMLLFSVGAEIARRSVSTEKQEFNQVEVINIVRKLLKKDS